MSKAIEVQRVKKKDREIVLVGTAHISRKSLDLVKKTIREEKPDLVGVELDSQRYKQLKSGKKWMEMDLFEVIRSGKTYLLLLNLLLSSLQKRFGDSVGIKPGEEMLAAIKEAEEKNLSVELLDRDITVTLKRAIAEMGFLEKLKLLFGVIMSFFGFGEKIDEEKVEELKQGDILTELMDELSRELPSTKKVLVDERDLFIANKILNAKGKKIVAVLGLGHLNGVKKYLDKKRNISHLNKTPKKRNYLALVKYLVPVLLAVIIGLSFYFKGIESVVRVLFVWLLINSVLASLGALLARAHWKSILAAFVSAPLTSLHPALAAGWFAGIVELRERCPRVKDFESLDKLQKLPDFYKNRVTRVLLVVALTNAGSILGTFIALGLAATLL